MCSTLAPRNPQLHKGKNLVQALGNVLTTSGCTGYGQNV